MEAGTKVLGVDPSASVAPFLGTSTGVITWTLSSATAPVQVTLARTSSPVEATWNDCPDPAQLDGFIVPVTITTVSEDGLFDGAGDGQISVSASGEVPAQRLQVSVPFADSAGDAGAPLGASDASNAPLLVTFSLDADGGAGLQSGQIDDGSTTLATLTFGR